MGNRKKESSQKQAPLQTEPEAAPGNSNSVEEAHKPVVILDNHTNQLKAFFNSLLFKNFNVRYFTNVTDALEAIRQRRDTILICQLLLYNSDITLVESELQAMNFHGHLIVINTDPLAEKAVQSLKYRFRYFIRDLKDLDRIEYMVRLLSRDNLSLPLEMSPFVERAEAYQIKIPSDLYYIDRVVQFILKKLFAVTFTHHYDNPIRMVLVEAISNAIEHGNRFDIRKQIQIVFQITKEKFYGAIADQGEGFNTSKIKDISKLNQQFRERGRGLFIINKFMDKVWHNDKGNVIYFEKYFVREQGN